MVALAEAFVEIRADTSRLQADLKSGVSRSIDGPTKQLRDEFTRAGNDSGKALHRGVGSGLRNVRTGVAGLAGAMAGLGALRMFSGAINEAREAAKATRITEQVIKTTGGAANVTAAHVAKLSERVSEYAAVDDDAVQAGANLLLTFKNIRNEAGKGNDVFDQAIRLAADLSVAFGQDLSSSSIQLGKALDNPIKGVTALSKVGVSFTDQQKEQIRVLTESGEVMEAQKIILAELATQVGGAAGAAKDPLAELSVVVGNVKESIGTSMIPALEGAAEAAKAVAPGVKAAAEAIGFLGSNDITRTAILGLAGVALGMKTLRAVRQSELATLSRSIGTRLTHTTVVKGEAAALRELAASAAAANAAQAGGVGGAAGGRFGRLAGFGRALPLVGGAVTAVGGVSLLAGQFPSSSEKGKSLGAEIAGDPERLAETRKRLSEVRAEMAEVIRLRGSRSGDAQKLAREERELTVALKEAEAAARGEAGATREAKDAHTQAVAAAAAHREIMLSMRDAVLSAASAQLGYKGSLNALRDATGEVRDRERELAEAQQQHGPGSALAKAAADALGRSQLDLKGQYLAVAESAARLKEEQARAAGVTDTATVKSGAYRSELRRLATSMAPDSPMRRYLLQLIRQLDAAGRDRTATLTIRPRVDLTGGVSFQQLIGGLGTIFPATPPERRRRRQHGGPVTRGEEYLVGETRPELFRAPASGYIHARVPTTGGEPGSLAGVESLLQQLITVQQRGQTIVLDDGTIAGRTDRRMARRADLIERGDG